MNNYFEINNVTAGYKNGFKIKNINFSISKGSFIGIIGPNGSGKSTLFKSITGDIKIKAGDIFLNKTNLNKLSLKEKAKKIAIVSQFNNFDNVTVNEYVIMGRIPHKKQFQFFDTKSDIELAEKYMKMTNIAHLKNKNRNNLSGGEQQLTNIACALTQEPELLLLDEPNTYLDISNQMQFMNLVQQLNSELSITVIIIIHDINLACEYCDYLILMNNGEIYKQGTPENVVTYNNIEDVYKTVVITKINPISKRPVIFPVSNKSLALTANSNKY